MRKSLPFLLLLWVCAFSVSAQSAIADVCPSSGIQPRPAEFRPGGIILAPFDGANMWVYDIDLSTRYPLPQTRPCASNCQLSPDANWISFLNTETFVYSKMRLDGTQRTPLVSGAAEVQWWSADTLLIWTPDHRAYLRPEDDATQAGEALPVRGVRAVQPGGRYALRLTEDDAGNFLRVLTNLDDPTTPPVILAPDRPYFNQAAWSPDGRYLAYVGNGALDESAGVRGGEIFLVQPGSAIPTQATFLFAEYGAVRINGFAPDGLSWSPDSRWIAFWVIELLGNNVESNTGNAVLHLLDVQTFAVRRYCGFATTEHTPDAPTIVWSPDGSHVAFAGNVPADNKGALLLALNIETGQFTELSDGVFPAYNIPNVTAWGNRP